MSKNRIIVEVDKKGNIGCSVTRCVIHSCLPFTTDNSFTHTIGCTAFSFRDEIYLLFAFCLSSTAERKSRTSIVTKQNKFCLKHNAMSEVSFLIYSNVHFMLIVLFVYPPTSSGQRHKYMYMTSLFSEVWNFCINSCHFWRCPNFFNKHIVFLSISLSQLKVLDKLGSFL